MGEALHEIVREREGTRCRIYAPVGAHRDLLAYLVRRLLENGANSSFVNQIVDKGLAASEIAADPIAAVEGLGDAVGNDRIRRPAELFAPRLNSRRAGTSTSRRRSPALVAERERWRRHRWEAGPMLAVPVAAAAARDVVNPADPDDVVGQVREAGPAEVARRWPPRARASPPGRPSRRRRGRRRCAGPPTATRRTRRS